jgi:hypothetical protein
MMPRNASPSVGRLPAPARRNVCLSRSRPGILTNTMIPPAKPLHRLSIVRAATAAALVLAQAPALATEPTTTGTDCVAASHASLDLSRRQDLRAARAQLLICSAESCPEDIRKDCVKRTADVSAQIPTLIVTAKDASGAPLTAVKVTMDGEVLAERLEGTGVAVDPGEHTFTFEAAGQQLVTKTWMIQQTQKERREDIAFEAPAGPAPAVAQASKPTDGGQGSDAHKTAAFIGVGFAVAGLIGGTTYGVLAISRKNDAHGVCPGSSVCATPEGVSKWSSAQSAANISTLLFVVGGLGALEAAIFWFTPSAGSAGSGAGGTSTQVGIGPGGLQLKGAW